MCLRTTFPYVLFDWYPCLVVVHLRDSLTSCGLVEILHKLALLCCECISKKIKKILSRFSKYCKNIRPSLPRTFAKNLWQHDDDKTTYTFINTRYMRSNCDKELLNSITCLLFTSDSVSETTASFDFERTWWRLFQ